MNKNTYHIQVYDKLLCVDMFYLKPLGLKTALTVSNKHYQILVRVPRPTVWKKCLWKECDKCSWNSSLYTYDFQQLHTCVVESIFNEMLTTAVVMPASFQAGSDITASFSLLKPMSINSNNVDSKPRLQHLKWQTIWLVTDWHCKKNYGVFLIVFVDEIMTTDWWYQCC